jgi:hypothetical protein
MVRAGGLEDSTQELQPKVPCMEKSSKRGKIPQQDWPSIITRYEAGETLASIARTYDCSPPAISYIVSRTKARSAAADAAVQTTPATPAERQLLKGPSLEVPASNIPASAMLHDTPTTGAASPLELPVTEPRLIEQPSGAPQPREPGLFPDEPPQAPNLSANPVSSAGNGPIPRYGHIPRGDPSPAGNGNAQRASGPAGEQPQNGESRRTLHLSLPHGNGGPHGPDSLHQSTPNIANAGSGDRFNPHPTAQSAVGQPPRQGPIDHRPTPDSPDVSARANTAPMRQPDGLRDTAPNRPFEGQRGREGGTFIDRALRERVDGDIAVFLAAFDAALDRDTPETRTELREATDRLLRAGARTRIELERLEARAPLPARDTIGQTAPLFRHR